MRWRLGLLLFLLGLGLGSLLPSVFSSRLYSQFPSGDERVVSLLRSIDMHLQSIERRVERTETYLERLTRTTETLSRNFDNVREWNAVRVRAVR